MSENTQPEGPLVVSYGMGLDSTAMLVEMQRRGIRPDLILFADTGGEKPETYAYLDVINGWLRSVGFPQVTVVRYQPVRAPYSTLEGKCRANETLPSLAFGGHSCALVFKRDVQVKFLKSWQPGLDALARGQRIVKAIGYDDGRADNRRSAKALRGTDRIREAIDKRATDGKAPLADQWEAANCDFWYPLQDWGLEREKLAPIVASADLPVPAKSACFFCPASKPAEVVLLKIEHPELYERAVAMENTARDGKHGLTTKAGLGMGGWSWEQLRDVDDPDQADAELKAQGLKIRDALRP